ncbi:MAG: hypothetical protein Q4G68_08405 [Planctomycetia bacterium]|nr:hypothetical protein [Planctomycetia bacterium]
MAKEQIDVYRDWLKIDATNRPLNYYQLLRLKMFEDDANLIRNHYRQLNAHIRKYATGEYIEESQALLNELAKAMLCLTDRMRKQEYDYSLGRQVATSTPVGTKRTLDQILLENRILSPEQLKKAQQFSEAVGVGLEMAVIQQKLAAPEVVMLAFAESEGLPFINLDETPVDEYYAPQINPVMARQYSFVPVMADMGKLILASPMSLDLDVVAQLETMFNMPVRCAIAVPGQINAAIAKYYPRDAVQTAPVAAAGTGTAPAPVAATPPKKKKEFHARQPLSEEGKKKRKNIAIITANFTIMAYMFTKMLVLQKQMNLMMDIPVALVLAGISCWIAWMVVTEKGE